MQLCLKFKLRGLHCRTIYRYSNFPYLYIVLEKLHRTLPIYRYTVTPLLQTVLIVIKLFVLFTTYNQETGTKNVVQDTEPFQARCPALPDAETLA